jgi:hypothetical protein
VIGAFLTKYNGSRLPNEKIGKHVLEELGVPTDSADHTLKLIVQGAPELGLIRTIKGSHYVDLEGVPASAIQALSSVDEPESEDEDSPFQESDRVEAGKEVLPVPALQSASLNNRVFITHGKNLEIVNQLKELLTFGNFLPIVAAERESISKPVPDKVMDDMRSCAAAIIHVGKEVKLLDQEGTEHIFLNQNVLIEIGAAMALYGRRFILLVERGAKLPSNLQGLYEVRYEGDRLDYEATMKLLKAFNDFRQ